MRILWITATAGNYQSPHSCGGSYNGGGWISSMQNELAKCDDIKLGIAFCRNGEPAKVEQDGVVYYPIPHHTKSKKDKILDLFRLNDATRDEVLWPYYEQKFKEVIEDFKPDVIHIFGSELYHGLAARVAGNIPMALHIQGLLSLYIYIYLPPSVSKWQYYMSGKGLKGKYHNYQYLAYWHRSVHREKAILKAVPHVIGRTDWDRQALAVLNPKAKYHYGGEILRDVFYEKKDRQIPKDRPVISTTISFPTYKGYDVILKVANILKNEIGMDFEWNVYGNVQPDFMEKHTGLKHDNLNVNLKGVASAEQLRDALVNSTLYFHSSYIENSPNSVGEAQLIGVPVVASRVGGTDSMVEHGKTGFLYPVTDPYMAAYYIKRLVENQKENISMGKAAREVALVRHDKQAIVENLLKIYDEITMYNK